jgi:membrane protease YdiL (CAAX protease family)
MQFYGFFPRFALGVLLGYMYLWSGTLWLPILAHFINNAGAVILTWYTTTRAPGINPDTIGTEPGQENVLALSVFMTLAGIWLLRKQLAKNTN